MTHTDLTKIALRSIWGPNYHRSCGERARSLIEAEMRVLIDRFPATVASLYENKRREIKPLPVLRRLLKLHGLTLVSRKTNTDGTVYRLAQIEEAQA